MDTYDAIVVAAILVVGVVAVHLTITYLRRRGIIFISYEHHLETYANELFMALQRGFDVRKLDFCAQPEHDRLLHRITSNIQDSDILICLPGNSPSFVDHEVSMAFALKKPILFISSNTLLFKLPNTGMHGYPVFSLDALRGRDYSPIRRMCSYLSGDLRSTVDIYRQSLGYLLSGYLGILFLSLVALFVFINIPDSAVAGLTKNAAPYTILTTLFSSIASLFIAVIALMLSLPFLAFSLVRFLFRRKLASFITSRRFVDIAMPEFLKTMFSSYGITPPTLFAGEIFAHHELPEERHEP